MNDDTRASSEPPHAAKTDSETKSTRSVWPFFFIALFFVVAGQVTFYVIAFSAGADELPPSAYTTKSNTDASSESEAIP